MSDPTNALFLTNVNAVYRATNLHVAGPLVLNEELLHAPVLTQLPVKVKDTNLPKTKVSYYAMSTNAPVLIRHEGDRWWLCQSNECTEIQRADAGWSAFPLVKTMAVVSGFFLFLPLLFCIGLWTLAAWSKRKAGK